MTAKNQPAKPDPASNRTLNNLKNGTRITRLSLGELPRKLSRVTRYCREYRKSLEAATAEAHGGEVTMTLAHHVDAACGHEQHLQIMRWLLRTKIDSMSNSDIIACSRAMADARDKRNRAVQQLDLDPKPEPMDLQTYLTQSQENPSDES